MNVNFKIQSLDKSQFLTYFDMSEAELGQLGAYLFETEKCPCYPCRVSLVDAAIGETVLAINFEHLPALSPYRSSGPIFVRKNALRKTLEINEVPELLRHRMLSVRGYNEKSIMIEAETIMGDKLESALDRQFKNDLVNCIHIHNSGPGCFNCAVMRM